MVASLPSPQEERRLLEQAARAAADVAVRHFGGSVRQWDKDDGTPVSEADMAVDRALLSVLRAARPDHGWLSEESGHAASANGRTIIVDPIDGTRAFLAGQSGWTIALAIVEAGRPIASAIYQPVKQQMFAAARDGGAFHNAARLTCPVAERLEGAEVAAPGPTFRAGALGEAGATKAGWVSSLALRLAYVAIGRIGAVVTKTGPHHWDLAAADLILTEAGGTLTDRTGGTLDYAAEATRHGPVVAGPERLVRALRERLAEHWSAAA